MGERHESELQVNYIQLFIMLIFFPLFLSVTNVEAEECHRGYYSSGGKCIPVVIPQNAKLDFTGHAWTCNDGYKRIGNRCTTMTATEKAQQEETKRKLVEEIMRRRAMRYSVYGDHSDECEDALDEADSAADELETKAKKLMNCASNRDFSEDCYTEFRRTKSAYSDYESAISDVSSECE